MKNYFDKEFELGYFEMDRNGRASLPTILSLLEETAADHCYSIERGLLDLLKLNIGWVLASGSMEMERYPRYKEKITIRTWLSSYSAVKGIRENYIYDEQHKIIGRARGVWVFFDIVKRRPIRIFDDILQRWSFFSEQCLEKDFPKGIDVFDTGEYMQKFKANLYDTDMNKHVNNIRYLQWLIETMPDEILDNYYLKSLSGNFVTEARYKDVVVSMTNRSFEENAYVHNIKLSDNNKLLALAKTTWEKL